MHNARPNTDSTPARTFAALAQPIHTGLLALALVAGGCAGGRGVESERLSSSMAPAAPDQAAASDTHDNSNAAASSPAVNHTQPANAHDAAVRSAAASELGHAVAATMPTVPPSAPPEPIDPGAARLVASIAGVLGDRSLPPDAVTLISVRGVRNLSRSDAGEFGAFMHRLCEVLSKAARNDRIVFTDNATAEAQFRLQGTAYMINADGFDQWEMYLTLTPSDRDFDIWDARGAVRVLRIARPNVPQITYATP